MGVQAPHPRERELINGAVAGDRPSFDTLVEHYWEWLYKTVSVMLGSFAEAEDVIQETFSRAFTNLSSFEERARFSTWFCGIALNLCRHTLRSRSRHAKPVSPETLNEEPSPRGRKRGVLSSVLRREISEQVELAVDRLPVPLKEAFVLRYIDGMSYSELAESVGESEGTVRVRAHRARTLLKAELGKFLDSIWK